VYDPLGGGAHAAGSGITTYVSPELPSTLDDLRAAVEQSEQVAEVEFPDCNLSGPGGYIRLVCSTQLSQQDFKRIQLAGLPREQRRKRMPDIKQMDEVAVYSRLIVAQCVRVELLNGDGSYRAVDSAQERPLEDPTLLAQLGVMDPVMGVKRVFGNRDALVMRAGIELQEACGYGEDAPGADPT
jgi:hypothetical protein